MYIPASLIVLVVCFWLANDATSGPVRALLTLAGCIAFAVYAPIPFLLLLAFATVLALLALLIWGGFWGMYLLERGAKALPNWRIFNEPTRDEASMRLTSQHWIALGMGAFVALTVLAHAILPR
jgi:hypothetical protein